MTRYITNNYPLTNLYKKSSIDSEIVTQMIYGDSFFILKRKKNWFKIKIKNDGYSGYVKNKKFSNFLEPTHKVHILKAKIYKFPNIKKKINELTFGSKIKVTGIKGKFLKFSSGWIKKIDTKPIAFKNKDIFEKISIFKNTKYKWGGKSFKGIDCSALVQICFNFNNKFCPRDAKDQLKFLKKNIKFKRIKKNDIIYWKGHVAVAISKNRLIHAYGPKKKVIMGDIIQTIHQIEKTAKLKVLKIKRI